MQTHPSPRIAVIDPNTLAALGMRQLLQSVMPIAVVELFGSLAELEANHPERYFHFFTAMNVVLEHRSFFTNFRRKTIVLTLHLDGDSQLSGFHCLCINVPEQTLKRQLMQMVQQGHGNSRHLPSAHVEQPQHKILTDREIEVMSLVAQGHINKEIAHCLNIGLSTVVTHRKNIMEKLGLRSVPALTIYAVLHGYVDINRI